MTTLTYPYLGDAVQVGQPLGCDPTGWPYRVEAVETSLVCGCGGEPPTFGCSSFCMEPEATRITVEPWPLPHPHATDAETAALRAAQAHARERSAGVIQ